ncbi:MAG: hypothetical protein ABW124_19745, partial [Candidatus Thiodiazotropha sp. 6PLUC9]
MEQCSLDEVQRNPGRLVHCSPGLRCTSSRLHCSIPPVNAYAIYPNRRFIPQRVRVLAEFLRKQFGDRPYWD